MKKSKKIIGILGGMGPQASAKMLEEAVFIAAKKFGAKNCEDFPEIIVFSLPVPDFIDRNENLNKVLLMFKEKVKIMEKMQVTQAGIACNTAHILLNRLQKLSKIPFVSTIEAVADKVEKKGIKKVGVLASPNSINHGLFQSALKKRGVEAIVPNKRQLSTLDKVIRKVIAAKAERKDGSKLSSIALSMKKCGAKGIILGCTELPLIFPVRFILPVFDSIKITAEALLGSEGGEDL